MTIKTYQYADPRDVRGLRFECKKCHAIVVMPLAEIIGGLPHSCINCKAVWSPLGAQHVPDSFEILVSSLRQFQQFNDSQTVGFSFSFELSGKGEAEVPRASASRASNGKD